MTRIALLGSTGSIGTQTLEVVRRYPDRLRAVLLTGHSNWEVLAAQILEFGPDDAVLSDPKHFDRLKEAVGSTRTRLHTGDGTIAALVRDTDCETVLNSLVGFAGFGPTFAALDSGKRVALANKESLVVGGAVLQPWLGLDAMRVLPVDSEHSAILQCLVGEGLESVEKLVVTASGGPFRTWSAERIARATTADALKHPNWSMGSKITIDSSTLMNKGLEVIEAYWMFGLPLERIEAVVHPQSIIHSFVHFRDGSVKAQLGTPDMRVPIQYALSWPERWESDSPRLDWSAMGDLTFEPVDTARFPCFRLAMESVAAGGYAPAVLNAANEEAVYRFLRGEIAYIRIPEVVERCLSTLSFGSEVTVDGLWNADGETRRLASSL